MNRICKGTKGDGTALTWIITFVHWQIRQREQNALFTCVVYNHDVRFSITVSSFYNLDKQNELAINTKILLIIPN